MKHTTILMLAAGAILSAGSAYAQQPGKPAAMPVKHATYAKESSTSPHKVVLKEAQPGLLSMATVNVDDASRTALASIKNGVITRERIEKRGERLVYVFGVRSHQRIHNVIVDAKTGRIVTPQAQAQKKSATTKKKDS